MRILHLIDIPVQIIILLGSLASTLIEPLYLFFGFYFGIGGWQLLMAIIFAFDEQEFRSNSRRRYEKLLIWVSGIGILCAFYPPILVTYMFGMILLGFGMAIWNLKIALEEYRIAKAHHEVWDMN
ncbi:MAG: hypothetical protein GC180_04240 [Bacteroidetes bacterium]|nr:hypothetical protein [Bacteroidota bacterium]